MTGAPLAERVCRPCNAGTPALSATEATALLDELVGWTIDDAGRLTRTLSLPDFAAAMALANRVADLAEAEAHHPDLLISWGRLRIDLLTHAISGLSENDFVLAAKIDRIVPAGAGSGASPNLSSS